MRVLQAHNRHATRGGADHVMDTDERLLTAAGHTVERFIVPSAEESSGSALSMGLAAVANRHATRELAQHITRFRPDVLHVHTPFPLMSPAVFWTARRHGVPTVATLHSFRYSCIAATLRRDGGICEDCVGTRLKTAGIRHRCYHDSVAASTALTASLVLHRTAGTFRHRIDRFLPLTAFAGDVLVRDGVPAEHITVKPNCVSDPGPVSEYAARDDVVLFAGRLVEEKGVDTLLRAWVRADTAGSRLVVAGDGPMSAQVQDAAQADTSIEFLGWTDQQRLTELQRRARVTVVPSQWYEAGPPLVLLQALGAGTPVLASDLDNISASVREEGAGLTFATGDADDLAARLGTLLRDPSQAQACSDAARALYERDHTEQASLRALEQVYADVSARMSASNRRTAKRGTPA
ncbi:MAG TPA: glycosyltransferase family 4 protein [Nocardioidaceae bacterium]|nr:glycosyltransferase family 4 protein [Nocardioidaceae bacterium]